MGLRGFPEACTIFNSVKRILLKWDKHCNILHTLADQTSGIERQVLYCIIRKLQIQVFKVMAPFPISDILR